MDTRNFIINELKKVRMVDSTSRITIKELDYNKNPLSPVKVAYRVFYKNINGRNCKTTYFGENVGFQG